MKGYEKFLCYVPQNGADLLHWSVPTMTPGERSDCILHPGHSTKRLIVELLDLAYALDIGKR